MPAWDNLRFGLSPIDSDIFAGGNPRRPIKDERTERPCVMMRAIKRTLGVAKKTFRCVRACEPSGRIMPSVFLNPMVHHIVRSETLSDLSVEEGFVRIQMRGFGDMVLEQFSQRVAGELLGDLRTYTATPLDKRDDSRLVARVPPPHAALFPSDVGLVCFDRSVKLVRRHDVLKGEADAVAHEPRRTIGADFKLALQLKCAYLCLAGAHHIETDQPLVEWDVRILADRPDCNCEAVKTFSTFVQASANFLRWVCCYLVDALLFRIAAMRADRSIWPAQLLEIVARGLLGREPLRNLHERKIALRVLAARRGVVLVCHDSIMTESVVLSSV